MDWEQRYASSPQLFGDTPSELLIKEHQRLTPGLKLLAIGDGEGRNGVWLARQGLSVTTIDLSPTAINRAQARAKQANVQLESHCIDLFEWSWPTQYFDVITSIFVHLPPSLRTRLYQSCYQALKPGGLLMIEGFHNDQCQLSSGGPADPLVLLSEDILEQSFPEAEILRMECVATQVMLNGTSQGDGAAIHFVAQRPPEP